MSTGEQTGAISRSRKTVKKTVTKSVSPKPKARRAAPKSSASLASAKKVSAAKPNKTKATEAKKPRYNIKIEKTQTGLIKRASDQLTIPATRGLMVLSPLRFPLDVDKVAVQTAKLAGAFFLLMGAVLTVWHSTQVFFTAPPMSFVAQVIGVNETSPRSISSTVSSEPRLEDGSIAFDLQPSGPLSGEAMSVRLTLPAPSEQAYLYARNTITGETVSFGAFSEQQESAVSSFIDVTQLPEGAYLFYVIANYRSASGQPYAVTIQDTTTHEIVQEAIVADETATTTVSEAVESTASLAASFTRPHDVTDPEILILLPAEMLTRTTDMIVNVRDATYLEAYALQENTGTQRYVGQPKAVDAETWRLLLDTTDLPNGAYHFVVNVRTPHGFFTERSELVAVYNETNVITDPVALEAEARVMELSQAGVVNVSLTQNDQTKQTPEEQLNKLIAVQQTVLTSSTTSPSELKLQYESLIAEHASVLEPALQALAAAYRTADELSIVSATERLWLVVDGLDIVSPQLAELVKRELGLSIERIKNDIATTNKLISERTAQAAETDTDRDGIADFDELTIYNTDPRVADSDGDGFPDGAEVLSGFDPQSGAAQAAVAYESPRTGGVTRDDLLSIDAIVTEKLDTKSNSDPVAIITGKGLPNSFVTLHIYSTPLIVTVRTDGHGDWIYRLDKILEDGEHQLYATITDNAGNIVAKSNPFNFSKVKGIYAKAELQTIGAAATSKIDPNTHSMISLILVTASISVVAIGLVLILLGVHLDHRRRKDTSLTAPGA